MRHSGGLSDTTRVAVLRGGWSPERDVSLKSGAAVIAALKRLNYDVIDIDPPKDLTRFAAQLVSARPHVVFNALHGTGGEDGIIAGALEMACIPYTHSSVGASAVAMDKNLTKIIAARIGIRVAPDKIITRGELQNGHPLQPPYVVKPISDGSSVGVTIVKNDISLALQGEAGQKILVEKYIPGLELTVGVLGDDVLGITQLKPQNEFYDFAAKYTAGVTDHLVNPDLPPPIVQQLKDSALNIHRALCCRDVSRSDFRYNPQDGVVFLEINTHPGMTDLSLLPEQAAAKGIDFEALVVTLLTAALRRSPAANGSAE